MRISWLLTLVRLKLGMLARRPFLILFCLVAPVLMSLVAGSILVQNDLAAVRGAYVDQAGNAASAELIALLESSGLNWSAITAEESDRALSTGRVDGVVLLPPHYGDPQAADPSGSEVLASYLPGNSAIASDLVIESFLISALALTREAVLVDDLLLLTDDSGISRDEMLGRLRQSTAEARAAGARLQLAIHNYAEQQRAPLIQIPDYAVELLFLSIFSLLASLMIADPATQQRLDAIDGGRRRDFLASLIALAAAGSLQLLLVAGLTQLLIPGLRRPQGYWPVMAVFLLLMLALGQLAALLPSEQRFVPASLILFLSALIGGTFIRLPSLVSERIGQYTPHGWALARLDGRVTTLSPAAAAGLGLALLLAACWLQTRRPQRRG